MSNNSLYLLTEKRFLPLFITQFLQAANDNSFKNAMVFLITFIHLQSSTTTTSALISITSGLLILPYFLFSAIAGQISDKYDKATLIRIIKLIEIIAMTVGTIGFYTDNLFILCATLFLIGIHSTLFGTIKYSILPQHLKKDELLGGNALIEGSTFIAILLGTSLGGWLIMIPHGRSLIGAISIGIAIIGLLTSFFIPQAPSQNSDLKISFNIAKDTLSMINHACENSKIYLSIMGISWFWFIGFILLSQLPEFTKTTLHCSSSVGSLLLSTSCIGIGAGSILCAFLQKGKITATYVPLGILGMSFSIGDLYWASHLIPLPADNTLNNISTFFTSFAHIRILIDILLTSAFGGLYSVPLYTFLQSESSDSNRSQIIAANNIFNALFMVLAVVVTLILLSVHFSIPQIFLMVGILNSFIALIACRLLPDALVKSFVVWLFNLVYRVKIVGLENYEKASDRVLIVANHVSFIDALLLSAYLPDRLLFAINTYIARKWWIKPIIQLVDTFKLDPANPMQLKSLIKQLKSNKRCMIFPEGRITVTGSLMKIYEGPALVADKAQAEILPIHLAGAEFTPFSRLKGIVRRRFAPKITITILPPTRCIVSDNYRGRIRRQKLGEQLYQIMSELIYKSRDLNKTLFQSLIEAKKTFGGNHLIAEDSLRQAVSYQRFILSSFTLGNFLHHHIHNKPFIGVLLPNMSNTAICIFAIYSRGKTPAMLNYSAGSHNVLCACQAANIKIVLTSHRFITLAKLQPLIETLQQHHIKILFLDLEVVNISLWHKLKGWCQSQFPETSYRMLNRSIQTEDPAAVLFTSGSEGTPKGVVLSHQNLQSNRFQVGSRIDFNAKDTLFNALPLFHSIGYSLAMLLPLLSGVKVFFYPSPLHYRIVAELIYDTDATMLFGTDTFLTGYARYAHPYDFYSLRYVFAGAERLRSETRQLWSEKFGVRIFEGYGATETAPVLSLNTPMHHRLGTVGKLLPEIDYQLERIPGIENAGKLWVRGPNVMLGYLRLEAPGSISKPSDGWYDTGDIVRIDEEGFITIIGRAKRFAKIAGEMVSLTAVEKHIARLWPNNLHAIISVPDSRKGEQLLLFTNKMDAQRNELVNNFRANGIAEIFLPKKVIPLKDMPLLGTGKINYVALTEYI